LRNKKELEVFAASLKDQAARIQRVTAQPDVGDLRCKLP
jgi:hypothetical protein